MYFIRQHNLKKLIQGYHKKNIGRCFRAPKTACAASSLTTFSPVEVVVKKRDGLELSHDEISKFVGGFHAGTVADYQMASFCMAVFLKGMSNDETSAMTLAMANSGVVMDWTSLRPDSFSSGGDSKRVMPAFVDKHSTGGVGDKVSLVLAPLAASFGLRVPMMSGRGLGHTGGTLDKLEAIPGLSTTIDTSRVAQQLWNDHLGFAIFAPTKEIAPVDKAIYALRDVAGSTESLPLIASSIMSKKIAENPSEGLVLDVKTGSGAFLQDWDASVALGDAMVGAGNGAGIPTVALLTSMDQPLGKTVGNWLETEEAILLCSGCVEVAPDVAHLAVHQVAQLLVLAKHPAASGSGGEATDAELQRNMAVAAEAAAEALVDGRALPYFRRMVKAQGGDPGVVDEVALTQRPLAEQPDSKYTFAKSKHQDVFRAPHNGRIVRIDTKEVGLSSVALGAGRQSVSDSVDASAGFRLHVRLGDRVVAGQPLLTGYCSDAARLQAALERAGAAYVITEDGDENFTVPPLISHSLTANDRGPVSYKHNFEGMSAGWVRDAAAAK